MAPINTPQYEDVDTPSSIPELPDDLTYYIFVFLEYRDLIHVERVCARWRSLSSDDVLWKREFLRIHGDVDVKNYRAAFYEKSFRVRQIRQSRDNVAIVSTLQTILVWIYGFLAPLVYLVSCIVLSVFIPLIADGRVTNIQAVSVPSVIILFSHLVTVLGLLVDPGYISRLKSRYIDYLIAERQLNGSDTFVKYQASYVHVKELDDGWAPSLNLIIWPFILVPLYSMSILNKLTLSYLECMWPVYLYCALYVALPALFTVVKFRTLRKYTADNGRLLLFFGTTGNLFNLLVLIQTILVGLKLDGTINTYWSVVCVPLWTMMVYIICMCQCVCIPACAMGKARGNVNALCCTQPVLLPIVPFSLLLILKLDNVVNVSYVDAFIPLYVGLGLTISCFLCCAGLFLLPLRTFYNFASIAQRKDPIFSEIEPTVE
jgi:hypothetical protein